MAELNDIKRLNGQPWSTWKKLCENVRTGEEVKKKKEFSHCMKLNRADMPIYGLCPKTEIFELVVCNYCGLKYKLPAFAEHINLKHSEGKMNETCSIVKPIVHKKGQLKRPKDKFKIKTESVTVNMKIDFLEIINDRQPLKIDPETIAKLKQLHVNAKLSIKGSENDVHNKAENSISINKSSSVIKSDLNKEIIQKLNNSCAAYKHDASSMPQDGLINMQPVVKLCPILTNSHFSSTNIRCNEHNKIKNDPKIIKISSCFNPDIHCGVIDGGNEPCLKSLDCKIHPVPLKTLVKGRSKLFEILLSRYLEEQNTVKNTIKPTVKHTIKISQVHTKEGPGSESVSVIPNDPPNSDNNITTSVKYENNCDPVPKIVSTKECIEENRKQCDSVSEDNNISSRPIKNNTNDPQGSCLPVSIKKPITLSQLQNIVSKYYKAPKPSRCSNIHDIIKGSFSHRNVKLSLNSKASKENMESVVIELDGTKKKPAEKPPELKLEWLQQWHPGLRKIGGLLYANHNITFVKRRTFITSVPSIPHEEAYYSTFIHQSLNIYKTRSNPVDLHDSDTKKSESKRIKYDINPAKKKSINAVISKQKNNFIMSPNHSKNPIPQKLNLSQSANSKAYVCKRVSNNINGALPAKVKKKDGMVNIISPVVGKLNKNIF